MASPAGYAGEGDASSALVDAAARSPGDPEEGKARDLQAGVSRTSTRGMHAGAFSLVAALLLAVGVAVTWQVRPASLAGGLRSAMALFRGDHEGCSWYEKADCPADRCFWKQGECVLNCSTLPTGDACWQQSHCMVDGAVCTDSCWHIFDEAICKSLPRCMHRGGECKIGCHLHDTEAFCPSKDQCMWMGAHCSEDPCSAPEEDCSNTTCCSLARGGEGMTCFQKDKQHAQCLTAIDTTGAQQGWSGKALGNRTKLSPSCAWAGNDCGLTRLCCNEGFNCVKKDANFSGCTQAYEEKDWGQMYYPVPAGWEGTMLGGWRSEFELPASSDKPAAGTSFYCFMAVLPGSQETELLQVARENKASIFACDDSKVYEASSVQGGAASNAVVFFKVLQSVKEDGRYLQHDWTIKVDVDTVFLPERLRQHIWALRPPADTAVYLKNTGLPENSNRGFLGAVEVMSKRAMQLYFDNAEDCGAFIGTGFGEDGYVKTCMDAIGVAFIWDKSIFQPSNNPGICTNAAYTSYHPMKYPSHWKRCWDLAAGKMCQGLSYDCGGSLDPPFAPGTPAPIPGAADDDYLEEDE